MTARRGFALATALASALALGACATPGTAPDGAPGGAASDGPLDAWVDRELTPYLVDELSNNPRFGDASVQLVKLDGQEVDPRIDALVDDIRANLFNALVATPGVDLAWRPSVRPWQHHRTLAEMDCGIRRPITHYVGIDLRRTASGAERVDVRALDLDERQWVSGFGRRWSGRLSASETVAADERFPDRYLRGLRPLPFDAGQADLATSYLAHNLSCLLREGAPERLAVHVASPPADAPAFFQTVATLAGRYLNQFREVTLVASPEAADAVVDSELVRVNDDELWQVWLGVTYREGGRRVGGADTPAYVALDGREARRRADPVQPSVARRDEPADVEPAPGPSDTAQGPPGDGRPSVATPPYVDVPLEPIVAEEDRAVRIDAFAGIVPASRALCEGENPWALGARGLETDEPIGRRGCFALEGVARGESVFLVTRSGEGEWFRLLGPECPGGAGVEPAADAGATVRVRHPARGALAMTGDGEAESFWLVAADGRGAARAAAIVGALPDGCTAARGASGSPMGALAEAARAAPGALAWRRLDVARAP